MSPLIDSIKQAFSPLVGVAPLMRLAFRHEDLRPLGAALLQRAQDNADDANALLDFSTVLQLCGDRDGALAVQAEAIRTRQQYSLPARQQPSGLRLLVIMGPGDLMSNTPVEFLVEESDVTLELLYLTLDTPWPEEVPDHDVMLVAVAESERNQPLLQQLAGLVAVWPRPVINAPERIARLSRDGVCAALAGMPGIDLPQTCRLDRATLSAIGAGRVHVSSLLPGDDFPMIVRPLGSHAGQNLEKLETQADIGPYLERVGADHFYLARFVDYRNDDGLFRKYRIALIQGKPYICHFAVSANWMIHYLNAGMDESAEKRRQEAECMARFDEEFASRHAQTLAEIDRRIGLPYAGIDCAETRDGKLLLFEIDNAMIVHAMDSEAVYPYKKPAMQKIFTAFRQLLEDARLKQLPAASP